MRFFLFLLVFFFMLISSFFVGQTAIIKKIELAGEKIIVHYKSRIERNAGTSENANLSILLLSEFGSFDRSFRKFLW